MLMIGTNMDWQKSDDRTRYKKAYIRELQW